MSIIILKRARATINDSWSDWVETTDPAPFENTDTVEYKIDYATDIKLDDLTNGDVVSGDWEGTGIFDVLTKSFNDNIELQYDKGRIDGNSYAEVYLGGMQSIISQSMEYLLRERQVEADIDLQRQQLETEKEQTKVIASQANVASLTEQDKINTATYQALKVQADKDHVKEQIESEKRRTSLVERQTRGFDDDAKQKLLKQVLDSWSVAYSVAKDANSIPDSIKTNSIDSITKSALDALNMDIINDPLNQP